MVEAVLRPRRRKASERWPSQPWATPRSAGRSVRARDLRAGSKGSRRRAGPQVVAAGRACSCDRVGCPAPGAHPLSPAWKLRGQRRSRRRRAVVEQRHPSRASCWSPGVSSTCSTSRRERGIGRAGQARRGGIRPRSGRDWRGRPDAVLRRQPGPPPPRRTSGGPATWTASLRRCRTSPGLRWHCRDSYVLAPPSALGDGTAARWLVRPDAAAAARRVAAARIPSRRMRGDRSMTAGRRT